MTKNLTLLGIGSTILATFLIVCMNTTAKLAAPFHNPVEMVFYRDVIGLTCLIIWIAFIKRRPSLFKTQRPLGQFYRALIGNLGVIFVFWAMQLMPLPNATALLFAAPLFITILSIFILGEKVGILRWIAVFVGFIGVILMAQPSTADMNLFGVGVALSAALFIAFINIALRSLGSSEAAVTTVFYFMLYGTIGTGLSMPFIGGWPHVDAYMLILLTAAFTLGAQIIKTQALIWAEASLLSSFSYTSLIWALGFGWFFWNDIPDTYVFLGASIVIASNLFITWREYRISTALK